MQNQSLFLILLEGEFVMAVPFVVGDSNGYRCPQCGAICLETKNPTRKKVPEGKVWVRCTEAMCFTPYLITAWWYRNKRKNERKARQKKFAQKGRNNSRR